ncbi:hypothetical protein ACFLYL_03575 [Chloroflexota bacterium]
MLAIVVALYIVTGFGITEFRIVEASTFGLLTKKLAFNIHNNLLIPSLILLALHILHPVLLKFYRKRKS